MSGLTATIQFRSGLTATLTDDGWQCDDPMYLDFIQKIDKIRRHPPYRDCNLCKVRAQTVAEMVGAKLIAWDEIDFSDWRENEII